MEYRIGICDDEMSTCSWLEMAIHDYMRWHNYKCQIYIWDSSDTFIKELKNKVDIDIFSTMDNPTAIFVSERLVEACEKEGITNILDKLVRVYDDSEYKDENK